ncbi:hypothetical protein K402DRAFT_204891 [Aulographum hederae CBS 113979]|uniref:Snf7-domain-containing protein n=1 Tax=Aulographum hederae CBS 113979 TaxID=1176131 RepID=A0A6G1HCW4_9PEZI|nr:hypothetical protein K402DRAFT_204891 [Aulographum hederae CBS 113979]
MKEPKTPKNSHRASPYPIPLPQLGLTSSRRATTHHEPSPSPLRSPFLTPTKMSSSLLQHLIDHEESFRNRNRIRSLYSDFSKQRLTNPDGFQANVAAWKGAIARAARAGALGSGGGLVVRTAELKQELESREHGAPLSLGSVVEDAIENEQLIPLKYFLNSQTNIYRKSWIPTPWQAMKWSLTQLGVMGPSNKLVVGDFVINENVDAAAQDLLKALPNLLHTPTDRIHSLSTFTSLIEPILPTLTASVSTDQTPLLILLTHLSRDLQQLSFDPSSGTIKLFAPHTRTSTPPEPVTPTDISIARLKSLLAHLDAQIPPLTARVEHLDATARAAVAKNQKTAAMAALRSKKLASSTLDARISRVEQLGSVLANIDAAADNVAMVAVMRESAAVLKGFNAEAADAEDVAEALREEMDRVEEVGGIINEVDEDWRRRGGGRRRKTKRSERKRKRKTRSGKKRRQSERRRWRKRL